MKARVSISITESGEVEVPNDVIAKGHDAIYDYLHDYTGNPWGELLVDDINIHHYEITWEEEGEQEDT